MLRRRCRKPGEVQKRANSTPPPFLCRYGTDLLSSSAPLPHPPRRHNPPPSRDKLSGSGPPLCCSVLVRFTTAFSSFPCLSSSQPRSALAFFGCRGSRGDAACLSLACFCPFWLVLSPSTFPHCVAFSSPACRASANRRFPERARVLGVRWGGATPHWVRASWCAPLPLVCLGVP